MCNNDCINWVDRIVRPEEVAGKSVLESGARDVNGSVRPIFEKLGCASYVGTDIEVGPRVDRLCDAVNLIDTFGAKSFDVVVSTEMLEHVPHWRAVVHNFKQVLKPGGTLFITTRSLGFGFHGYPHDYWRYECADMELIFSDMENVIVQSDPYEPGVFVKATKPLKRFREKDLSAYELYSINTLTRIKDV